jgi:hypothetical protein
MDEQQIREDERARIARELWAADDELHHWMSVGHMHNLRTRIGHCVGTIHWEGDIDAELAMIRKVRGR